MGPQGTQGFVSMVNIHGDPTEEEIVAAEAQLIAEWPGLVRAAGGEPLDEPVVERVPNLNYGRPLIAEHGPVLDDDGQAVTDSVRLALVGRALAIRGGRP